MAGRREAHKESSFQANHRRQLPLFCAGAKRQALYHKNQHELCKEACSNCCGYVQRRDKMRNHLKDCYFGKGIFFAHSTSLADAMKEQNMRPAPKSMILSILTT
jgi:hypothetical protein